MARDDEPGIVVTAAYAAEHVVWSRRAFSLEKGREVATAWLAEALRTGFIQVA
jgi:hypothetical protein